MITIHYVEHGDMYSDQGVSRFVQDVQKNVKLECDWNSQVSNELVILALRAAVSQGKIPHNKIRFKYQDTLIHVNKDGRFIDPLPEGFCDNNDNYLGILFNTFNKQD